MEFARDLPQTLQGSIRNIIEKCPESQHVFFDLHHYLTNQIEQNEVELKRRKVNGVESVAQQQTNIDGTLTLQDATILSNLSVSAPERRRFNLIFNGDTISLAKDLTGPFPRIDYSFSISDITRCLCLWVPEKAKPQYSLIIFTAKSSEPAMQITLPEEKVETFLKQSPHEDFKEYTCRDFVVTVLQKTMGITVEAASQDKCVNAYRGNKEGHLFMLDHSIFFGFKKPVILFPHEAIEHVSYSHITRVTFNCTVKLTEPLAGNPALEYEFSMIDQEDYNTLDSYMASKRFGNASLDESRKAKATTNEFSNELEKAAQESGTAFANDDHIDAFAQAPSSHQQSQPANGISTTSGMLNSGGAEDEDDEEEDEDYAADSGSDSGSGSDSEEDDQDDDDAVMYD